jgi:glyoxylase-like metal-dependent hydrolase (beta-lactamase superfamily II)
MRHAPAALSACVGMPHAVLYTRRRFAAFPRDVFPVQASMIDRRHILKASLGLAAAQLLIGRGAQAQTAMTTQALNPDLALIAGNGGNVLVRKAGNGDLLAVDGGLAANAAALLGAIQNSLGSDRVTTLVNTHWHHEHVGLNEVLGARGIRLFAHENTRQWLSTRIERPFDGAVFDPLPEAAQPNDTFYHYGALQHGDVPVEYGYLRQAHTDGDMYVFLPQDNVLHAGGIVSSDAWPLMDWWTGGWMGGLVDGIETLLSIANDSTVIVPATGPVMTKADLTAMRDMYAELFEAVRNSFMTSNTVEETLALKPAAAYEAKLGNSDLFIELSQWSLIPHYAPDA